MSAPNFAINIDRRKGQRIDPRALRQPIIARIMRMADEHNKQYPLGKKSEGGYSRGYYRRIKNNELTTALNLVQRWSTVACKAINGWTPINDDDVLYIDNIVPTNNRDARKDRNCKRGTPAHLAKAVSFGVILGRKATQDDAKQYQDRPKGYGCGWTPLKLWRGSSQDYQLLISPELLEGVLPKGVKLVPIEYFTSEEKPENRELEGLKKYAQKVANADNMAQKIRHFKFPSNLTDQNEEMIEVVSDESDSAHEEGNSVVEGNKNEAVNSSGVDQTASMEGNNDEAGSSTAENGVDRSASRLQKGLTASDRAKKISLESRGIMKVSRLLDSEIAREALLLLTFFLESVAVAMKRSYESAEIERGRLAAIELILRTPENERQAWINDFSATIERTAGAINHDPEKWAAPPGQWFHPDCSYGILTARQKFLLPWRKKADEMEKERNLAKEAKEIVDQQEAEWAKKDWYAWLAFRMRDRLMQLHPGDSYIKKAKLQPWRKQVKDLVEKDLRKTIEHQKARLSEVLDVWEWVAFNTCKQAEFWRQKVSKSEGGGKAGLRSAAGFRRNFDTIRKQYHDFRERQRKAHIKATTIPKKELGPKAIPRKQAEPKVYKRPKYYGEE